MKARLMIAAVLTVALFASAWSRNVDAAKRKDNGIARKIEKSIQTLEKNHVRVPAVLKRTESRLKVHADEKAGKNRNARIFKIQGGWVMEEIGQYWQEGAWVNEFKDVSTFQDPFYPLNTVEYEWEGGAWVNFGRIIFSYDGNWNMTQMLFEDWVNGAWVSTMAWIDTYDASGNNTSTVMQVDTSETPSGVLVNVIKTTSVFNTASQETRSELYFWDDETNGWLRTGYTDYTYDGQGNLIEELGTTDLSIMTFPSDKTTYTYDASGNRLTETYMMYDIGTDTWVNNSKYLWQYDGAGNETEEINQLWDGSAWVNNDRETYAYNAQGDQTEWLWQIWDNGWVNNSRTQDTYDASGNNTQTLDQTWENGAWVNEYLMNSTYDAQGNPVESIDQEWVDNAWVNDERVLYSFTTGIADEAPAVPKAFTLGNYPNPFNPSTTILFNLPGADRISVQILDVQGKTVRNLLPAQTLSAGLHRLAWDGRNDAGFQVSSGLYLYKVAGGSFNGIGRCLLAR